MDITRYHNIKQNVSLLPVIVVFVVVVFDDDDNDDEVLCLCTPEIKLLHAFSALSQSTQGLRYHQFPT